MNNYWEYLDMDAVIYDIRSQSGTDAQISESNYITWVTDCINMVKIPDNATHHIAIEPVANYSATLPENFLQLKLAAGREEANCSPQGRTGRINQWLVGGPEDCQLEINLLCKKCNQKNCNCDGTIIEVDVDRIWEMNHPEIYYKNYVHYGRFGEGGPMGPYNDPEWKIMQVAQNRFFNPEKFLGDCPNIRCPHCPRTFQMDGRRIEVDFKEGEVLVSYLGTRIGEDGNVMIPNDVDMLAAIRHYVYYQEDSMDARRYKYDTQGKGKMAMQYANQNLMLHRDHIAKWKSKAIMPNFTDWMSFVRSVYARRIPNFNGDMLVNEGEGQMERYDRMLGATPRNGRIGW